MVPGQCFLFPFHIFLDILKDLSNVIDHWEFNFTWKGVFNGPPEVFVNLTPYDGHHWNISILCIDVSENNRDNIRIKMPHFHIVDMPEYSALL